MEMRLRAPVTRGYFFLLGALRLVNAASPRNIDQKKISSGTQGILKETRHLEIVVLSPKKESVPRICPSTTSITQVIAGRSYQ